MWTSLMYIQIDLSDIYLLLRSIIYTLQNWLSTLFVPFWFWFLNRHFPRLFVLPLLQAVSLHQRLTAPWNSEMRGKNYLPSIVGLLHIENQLYEHKSNHQKSSNIHNNPHIIDSQIGEFPYRGGGHHSIPSIHHHPQTHRTIFVVAREFPIPLGPAFWVECWRQRYI